MRMRRWLTVVWLVLALGTTGVAAAQIKAGDEKAKARARTPNQEKKEINQSEAGRAKEAEPVAGSQAEAVHRPAEPEKSTEPAAPISEEAQPAAVKPAEAEPTAGAQPAAGRAAEPPAASPYGPPSQGDRKFFGQEQRRHYRFLTREQGEKRYFTEQRVEARPTGPPLRIEPKPEPERVRGDAGAAIGIGLSFEQDWNLDKSYDLFGEDDVAPRVSLWFSYDLLSLGQRTILSGEIGVGSGRDETRGEFDGMATTLQNTRLQVAVYLRQVIWPVFQPHLRLAGHLAYLEADLDFHGEERFSDNGFTGGGSLGAGFMVRTPTRLFENRRGEFASLSFGVLLEGGYMLASPVSFELVEDQPEGRVEVRYPPLGELALSGPYFRSSLLVRF